MSRPRSPAGPPETHVIEYGFLPGLDGLVRDEVDRLYGDCVSLGPASPGWLQVRLRGSLEAALAPRTVGVAYLVVPLDAPRPRALLGDENRRSLVRAVALVVAARPPGGPGFRAVRFSAAGQGSPVFQRLAEAVSAGTGLPHDPDDGDLVIRVVPDRAAGWKVGVRLTPRPLSARPWRVARFRGALEPTAAAAMVQLTRPRAGDRFLDLCCGSGTLLIERLLAAPAAAAVGVDVSGGALAAATTNLEAAGTDLAAAGRRSSAVLARTDATGSGMRDGWATTLVANPPWGHRRGSHDANRALYPALLSDAARVAAPDATFVVITHEVRLFGGVLATQGAWRPVADHRVALRGHHPRIWVLRRR